MSDYDVIVIGAGLGGLSAGALLAKEGKKVLVLEQSDLTGGCCSSFQKDGYTFDIGASIVEAVKNMAMVFEKLGTSMDKELDLLPCDPIYSCIFRDGERTAHYHSIEKTAQEIGRISPEDEQNFYKFTNKFQQFIDEGGEDFFTHPVNTLTDMLSMVRKRPVIAKFLPFFLLSYQDIINLYFKDERIRESMSYQSFYIGHPPDLSPGIFAILPYFEHLGVFYPRGGMVQIPKALERVGKGFGMQVQYKKMVKKVLVKDGRAKGVVLADGTEISADVIVSNVNAKMLYLDLIGKEHLPPAVVKGVNSYKLSLTCPMVYLGLDYKPPLDAHHTIIPLSQEKMNEAWWNGYLKGKTPEEQFGLICMPTYTDPSLAPEGHHILNLILMGPYELQGTDWDTEKEGFIKNTIEFLDKFALPGLAEHVTVAEMSTPLDYHRRLNLPDGAIYGLQQDLFAQAVFRPANQSRSIKGLYLTGASTHPGGGVPTTISSGYVAAQLILEHEF